MTNVTQSALETAMNGSLKVKTTLACVFIVPESTQEKKLGKDVSRVDLYVKVRRAVMV